MGEVYRAFDTAKRRTIALKRLPRELASDASFQARFRRESELAARLGDPHVIPIHDYGEIDSQLFIDMRLVRGTDLAGVLADQGPLAPERAVHLVSQIAEALDAAHADGLIHRDVKPSNVLLAGVGHDFVYLVDFGIARMMDGSGTALTTAGSAVGTLAYMAPERFDSSGDHRVDIYALACLLHETLTGQQPFSGDSLPALLNAHLNVAPPRPSALRADIPAALDEVVARGMAKDPRARFQRAGDLATAARASLVLRSPEPVEAPTREFSRSVPGRSGNRPRPPTPRKPVVPPTRAEPPPLRRAPADPSPATPRSPTRRKALIAGGTVGAVAVTGVAISSLIRTEEGTGTPPAAPNGSGANGSGATGRETSNGAAALAATGDVPVGGGVIFPDQDVVVTQPVAGTFKAFSASCTHTGCLVNAVRNGTINCPCHGSKYAIDDGSVVNGPAPRPLSEKAVTVQGNSIILA